MTLRDKLFEPDESDRAVSPVIGVILMVAITVILAAVIGTFVLQIGQNTGSTAPSASLSFSDDGENYQQEFEITSGGEVVNQSLVEINHQNGETLEASQLRFLIRDENNSVVGEWQAGTWDTQLSTNQSGNFSVETWTLALNGDSDAFDEANYEDTTFATGDRIVLRADLEDSAGGNAPYPVLIEDVPDQSDYTIQLIDTESGNQIGSAEVEVN